MPVCCMLWASHAKTKNVRMRCAHIWVVRSIWRGEEAHFSCRALTKVWIMAWKAMMLGLWMSSSRSIAAGSFPGMEEVLATSSMLSGCAAMPGVHITHSMHEVNGYFQLHARGVEELKAPGMQTLHLAGGVGDAAVPLLACL